LVNLLTSGAELRSHLQAARGSFEYRMGQRDTQELWSEVWNVVGSGELLDKVSALQDGFGTMERALDDLELAVMEECLQSRHERHKLLYQASTFASSLSALS
ncbi:hypothetical protein V5O48_019258, partial [Marasmius crinis-equi]